MKLLLIDAVKKKKKKSRDLLACPGISAELLVRPSPRGSFPAGTIATCIQIGLTQIQARFLLFIRIHVFLIALSRSTVGRPQL